MKCYTCGVAINNIWEACSSSKTEYPICTDCFKKEQGLLDMPKCYRCNKFTLMLQGIGRHSYCQNCVDKYYSEIVQTEKLFAEQRKNAEENSTSPGHYKTGGIECIDYMRAKMTPEQFEGYCLGNVIKYVSRYRDKNGVEDLKKASVYLNWLIEGVKNR